MLSGLIAIGPRDARGAFGYLNVGHEIFLLNYLHPRTFLAIAVPRHGSLFLRRLCPATWTCHQRKVRSHVVRGSQRLDRDQFSGFKNAITHFLGTLDLGLMGP